MSTTAANEMTRNGWDPVLSPLTLVAIQAEATRAHILHGDKSMMNPDQTQDRRLAILAEEFGEVSHELNDAVVEGRPVDSLKLVKELIQVAAMAASWVEVQEGQAVRLSKRLASDA